MSTQSIERHAGAELVRARPVPTEVNGDVIPRDLVTLKKVLAAAKNSNKALSWHAGYLAELDAQQGTQLCEALYLMGGIPDVVEARHVLIFDGRPYVSAQGAVQVVIAKGGRVVPSTAVIRPCGAIDSLCPESTTEADWVARLDRIELLLKRGRLTDEEYEKRLAELGEPALVTGLSYIVRATASMPGGGQRTVTRHCCPHDWAAGRTNTGKGRLEYMAATRACRRAAIDLLGIDPSAVRDLDDPDSYIDAPQHELSGADDASTGRGSGDVTGAASVGADLAGGRRCGAGQDGLVR